LDDASLQRCSSCETYYSQSLNSLTNVSQIILSLDNFNRHQSAREYAEHRQLVSQTINILSASISVSSIAARGTRLLSELLAEEHKSHSPNTDAANHSTHSGKQRSDDHIRPSKNYEKSLNVAAFVKKFCESDQPAAGNSPIATNVPLWLQDSSSQAPPGHQRMADDQYSSTQGNSPYPGYQSNAAQSSYEPADTGYQMPMANRRQYDAFANAYGQHVGESFDIRSVNWFDDLLGLAPSHSI
jgi:hypothetical protein